MHPDLLVVPAVVAGVAVVLLGLVFCLQRRLIYFPGPAPGAAAAALPGARDVVLHTSDGLALGAWFLPAGGDVTVLLANGNGGSRADRVVPAQALAAHGMSVLLFDYRGYGGNPGRPSEGGLALDIRAARDYLVHTEKVTQDQLLYFGESLGTAVVTELATEHPPAGLLLRSPFVDLPAIGRLQFPWLPVRLLLCDRFPQAANIGRVAAPTTVVFGTADRLVPPQQSLAVAAAAGGPTEVVAVQGAGHNDRSLFDGPELMRAVCDLADRAVPP